MEQWKKYAALVALGLTGACVDQGDVEEENLSEDQMPIFLELIKDEIPNNFPSLNPGGIAASATASGSVALNNEFFTAQGTNGRDCGTCHAPEDGWSMNGSTVTVLFLATEGTHPIFVNNLDTDTPTCDMTTVESRWNCTTKLRQGLFTRSINVPATRQYDITAVSDPFGVSTLTRMWFFRRDMPTANFRSSPTNWDSSNTQPGGLRDSLIRQATGNITGAQQGAAPLPATTAAIADYQLTLGHAQLVVPGAGRLDKAGGKGGPENALTQGFVAGRFDLYDGWADSHNPWRKQIYRGQEVFNNVNVASGRRCGGCHNAANNGANLNGTLFNVGASDVRWADADDAIFTVTSRIDGTVVQTTDLGRAARNGNWADLNKFDTPNLRGLASRAPYFHNGLAANLHEVVDFYEESLGFDFTEQEEDDLVAFMNAL